MPRHALPPSCAGPRAPYAVLPPCDGSLHRAHLPSCTGLRPACSATNFEDVEYPPNISTKLCLGHAPHTLCYGLMMRCFTHRVYLPSHVWPCFATVYSYHPWRGVAGGRYTSAAQGARRGPLPTVGRPLDHAGLVRENPTSSKEVLAPAVSCSAACIHRRYVSPPPTHHAAVAAWQLRRACSPLGGSSLCGLQLGDWGAAGVADGDVEAGGWPPCLWTGLLPTTAFTTSRRKIHYG
jgi:hypothetical protein